MARKRTLLAVAACALTGLGAWTALRGSGDVEYRTVPAERGTVAYNISASGNLNAVVTVQVGSQVSGNIQALYADFNTRVNKGQVVARIDPQVFQARVDQARATLNSVHSAVANAQANLQKSVAEVAGARAAVLDANANILKAQAAATNAKTLFDRRVELEKEGVLAREDRENAQATYDTNVAALEAAKAQAQAAQENVKAAEAQVSVNKTLVDSAQANVKQAAAALEQAQLDLNHTYITAPVDGVVVARQVDVGQTVAASLQAPTLFEIAQDLTKMQVDTNVSEADVGRVQVGQPAFFTVDAYPGVQFHGAVAAIRKAPINVQNVITYDVVITAANPDLKLFPGMTANVNILVAKHDDVLKVPNAALRYRPAEAAPNAPKAGRRKPASQVVWVLDAGVRDPRPVNVQTGLSDGAFTEIVSGDLKPGDRVVTAAISEKEASPAARGPRGPRF
ncbi:MAG: efflux RND transporter periplasmic adaptor subunit [Acidobacteria bacterium]|nr:efflux RND transporter periplasmic adaptor subunit [Acidobacteriota bacterium]